MFNTALRFRFALIVVATVAAAAPVFGGTPAPSELNRTMNTPATTLDEYVAAPDDAYRWDIVGTYRGEGYVSYVVDLKSQSWRSTDEVDRTVWQHWLTIVRPDIVKHRTGFLFINGGDNGRPAPEKADDLVTQIAVETQTVAASLGQIPNQPLTFAGETEGRKEDSQIAYTWDKFLRGADDEWLSRYPMTKAAVRAMDAIIECMSSAQGGGIMLDSFVVAGGSKRGWTTWTTGAVDDRVVAVIPFVIDLLNVVPSFVHHYQAYGFWAPAVGDYQAFKIMEWMGHDRYDQLLHLVEPYSYRERMTIPKFVVNSTGDQFFLPDSSQFYWDDLPESKHLRYVPNADHGLDGSDALQSAIAYYYAILNKIDLPKYQWNVKGDKIIVKTPHKPTSVTLWQATNPDARDFRKEVIGEAYQPTPIEPARMGKYVGKIAVPEAGWTAAFVELTFDIGAPYPLKCTSQVVVRPDVYPHEFVWPEAPPEPVN